MTETISSTPSRRCIGDASLTCCCRFRGTGSRATCSWRRPWRKQGVVCVRQDFGRSPALLRCLSTVERTKRSDLWKNASDLMPQRRTNETSRIVLPGEHLDQHPETQLNELRQFAANRGFKVVGEYTDHGYSGAPRVIFGSARTPAMWQERCVGRFIAGGRQTDVARPRR